MVFYNRRDIENFSNESGVEEDIVYAKIYNLVFDNNKHIKKNVDKVLKYLKDKKDVKILDANCGIGANYKYLSEQYMTVGVDGSREYLKYATIRNPSGKFIEKDLREEIIFKPEEFTDIVCLMESFYNSADFGKILENFYFWLKKGGNLYINIYDRKKLDPAPKDYTQYYKDKNGIKHGLTYFNKFTHDAYWKQDNVDTATYVETIVLEDGRKKIKEKKLYIPLEKSKIVNKITEYGFKLINIEKGNPDLYIFQK